MVTWLYWKYQSTLSFRKDSAGSVEVGRLLSSTLALASALTSRMYVTFSGFSTSSTSLSGNRMTSSWLPWTSYQIRKLAGCVCAGNAGNVFPATDFKWNCGLAIPACITARAWRTWRNACRDRQPAGVGENVPGIPGACAIRNFAYLSKG